MKEGKEEEEKNKRGLKEAPLKGVFKVCEVISYELSTDSPWKWNGRVPWERKAK